MSPDLPNVTSPVSDPTPLYRLRDGVYAADLLIVAVCDLDLFTWLARAETDGSAARPVPVSRVVAELGLRARPVVVVVY